ncbi:MULTISPECIES: hypothetical protein [Streptomyces]|uniref:hypothetical protein n=1 Tax=Streptomyces TaxID=1883 RepID=UPI003251BFD2
MPRMCRMFVATTKYLQPLFSSNAVSFLVCRPEGRTRQTAAASPAASSACSSLVNSATL